MSAGRCSAFAATSVATLAAALVHALAAAPLGAQTTLGLRGGIGAAFLSGNETRRSQSTFDEIRYALVTGVDAGIPLSGGLGVRLGLGLASKGGGADVPASITTGRALTEAQAEFDYVQFSALLSLSSAAEQGQLTFSFLAGPYVALNRSCNVGVTSHEPPIPPPPTVPPGVPNLVDSGRTGSAADTKVACGDDGTPEVKSSDFGLALGGGFEVRLSDSLGLAFELMYARGLSEIDDLGRKTNHLVFQSGLVFAVG